MALGSEAGGPCRAEGPHPAPLPRALAAHWARDLRFTPCLLALTASRAAWDAAWWVAGSLRVAALQLTPRGTWGAAWRGAGLASTFRPATNGHCRPAVAVGWTKEECMAPFLSYPPAAPGACQSRMHGGAPGRARLRI